MIAEHITVRELSSPGEFRQAEEVSRAAWGFREREISPAADLIAATHAGGLTAGAFADGKLLGFVHAIPRTNLGRPAQHSHLLAVRPMARRRGLALRLKLFQRSWCLERGIAVVTWTYDPFLVPNAVLNLVRLQATVGRLLPDFYGPLGGIYGGLPTDRFEVTWILDDPRVERAARGLTSPPPAREEAAVLPFPEGAPAIYRSDPAGSVRARKRFRRLAEGFFSRRLHVTGFVSPPEGPAYLLT